MKERGNDDESAFGRHIRLVKFDPEIDKVLVRRVRRECQNGRRIRADRVARRNQRVARRDVLVGLISQLVGRSADRLIHHIDVLLGPVEIVNYKIEILRLVDEQRLLGVGQSLGRDVGVLDVVIDRRVADRRDLDGIALLRDVAFVIAVHNARLPVNKSLLKGFEEPCGPNRWNKVHFACVICGVSLDARTKNF